MAEIGYERIWGVTDSEWESILRYLGAAYRPRVEYNQDPLLLATRTIQEMKAQVAAALAVIDRDAPDHISEMVDFARTGDLRP